MATPRFLPNSISLTKPMWEQVKSKSEALGMHQSEFIRSLIIRDFQGAPSEELIAEPSRLSASPDDFFAQFTEEERSEITIAAEANDMPAEDYIAAAATMTARMVNAASKKN